VTTAGGSGNGEGSSLSSNQYGPAVIREMILLSGPSGSGKTRLARTLQEPVIEQAHGYFLSGKFDKLNLASPAPYTGFGAAFGEFATAVQRRGVDELQRVRSSIQKALGSEASVLTRMIPGLEPLCGPCEIRRPSTAATTAGAGGDGRSDQSTASSTDVPTKAQANKASAEAIKRFVFVFRTFLRAVATPQRPMVLLLDDIHFAVRTLALREATSPE
jgi:predicted ATPase